MDARVSDTSKSGEAAEQELRRDLAACYRMIAHYGWDDLIFTHISARVPGPEVQFLMNPYGLMFDQITASSLIKVDLSGQLISPGDGLANPAGFTIHSAIHAARDDAHCVLHLHTIAGQAVAAQSAGLLPITQVAAVVLGDLAYHDYEGIAVVEAEKERLVADLGDKNFMILRNHGLLTVGETVGAAFLRMYFLERACQAQIAAQSGGAKLTEISAKTVEAVSKQTASLGAADMLTWAAVLKKVQSLDPGFAD